MTQCLQVLFVIGKKGDFVNEVLLKKARLLGVEGLAYEGFEAPNEVKVVVCGKKEALEQLVDLLHQSENKGHIADIIIEPVIKERDYRGVFRVIEK